MSPKEILIFFKTYNIRKDWLLTGNGEMENKRHRLNINDFSTRQDLTDLDIQFLKKYLNLSKENRKLLAKLLINMDENNHQ